MESLFTFFGYETAFLNFLVVLIFVLYNVLRHDKEHLIDCINGYYSVFYSVVAWVYLAWGVFNLISFIYQLWK